MRSHLFPRSFNYMIVVPIFVVVGRHCSWLILFFDLPLSYPGCIRGARVEMAGDSCLSAAFFLRAAATNAATRWILSSLCRRYWVSCLSLSRSLSRKIDLQQGGGQLDASLIGSDPLNIEQ